MKHNSNVPAFLTKLWTLVEDADTNEFICWSQEGNSFLVLDEQRFAKEILPKFFKHNNMASFIRQLNMYGFRKVMHIDTGIVKQERDGPVEFQHPYFKHGQDDLLENIKRKVSNARPEEGKIRQEDLTKILASVHSLHGKQESMDARLATLKRLASNLTVRSELDQSKRSGLRLLVAISDGKQSLCSRSASNFQSRAAPNCPASGCGLLTGSSSQLPGFLSSRMVHALVVVSVVISSMYALMGGSRRPGFSCSPPTTHRDAQMMTSMAMVKASGEMVHPAMMPTSRRCHAVVYSVLSSVNSLNGVKSSELSDDVIICDVTDEDAEAMAEITEGSSRFLDQSDVEIVEVEFDSCAVLPAETEVSTTCADDMKLTDPSVSAEAEESQRSACLDGGVPTSSALQLNKPSGLSLEDPVKMMDSILNESGAISQNINLLGKVELMDYLDSIDCSLEDFQAMLYGKQFSIDPDALEESVASRENTAQLNRGRTDEDNTDKQLIQYTSCPLLAFLDGCTDAHLLTSPTSAEPPSELLDGGPEPDRPPRSSLIRLEPLTEAEASAETLFYLCELGPDGPAADSAQLDGI
uniref:heat shock factor protein 2 n=1 Tax=Centroberyx gerrardi TaxID=166262 RepID=UPI003AAC2FBD